MFSKVIVEDYDESSCLKSLPLGTKFLVTNGLWYGEIIKEKGVKKVLTSIGSTFEIKEDEECCLNIKVIDMSRPLKYNDKFKHYKGEIYNYLLESKCQESGEKLVIYSDSSGEIFHTSKESFFSKVEFKGEIVPKFKRLLKNEFI